MSFAETPTGRIYVESHGQGPALVIVPSFGATTRMYRGLLPNLTETHRVVLYDLRGMGRSDDLPNDLTIKAMAGDVAAVLDHVGVARASVLGASMGAVIAQQFAVDHRDRLDRLVLLTPPVWPSRYRACMNDMLRDLLAACEPNRFMRYMVHLALSPDFVNKHPNVVEQMIEGIDVTPREAETMARLLRGAVGFDGVPGMAEMDAPTLIIAGELDIFTPPSQARDLHAELPDSRLIVMSGVAHTPFIERTAETFTAVRTFLTDAPAVVQARGPDTGETHP